MAPLEPDVDELIGATRAAIARQGCRCEVELDVHEELPGVYRVRAAHDDWCPLLLALHRSAN